MAEPPKARSYTSALSRVLAWGWVVVAVLLLVDIAVRGHDRASWIAAAVLLLTVGGTYALWLRPRVVSTARGLRVINPLRETFVPWSAVTWVDVTDVLRVHAGEQIVRSWPLRETKRAKVRENLRREAGYTDTLDHADPAELRPVELMARELRSEAERHKARPLDAPAQRLDESGPAAIGARDRPQTMVSLDAVVALALPVAVLAAVLLVT